MAKKTTKKTVKPLLRAFILAGCIVVISFFVATYALNHFTRHNDYYRVPDFAGMNFDQALQAAAEAKLNLEKSDSLYVPIYDGGVILEQRPKAGSKVKQGRRVFLTTNSFSQRMVDVPYVAGYSLRQAKNNLERAGLVIDQLIYEEDIATNYVLEQFYKDKIITEQTALRLEYGSAITLIVGVEPGTVPLNAPRLLGLSLRDAQSRLWELGLNVGQIEMDNGVNLLNRHDAKVYSQGIMQTDSLMLGDRISLSVTLDANMLESGIKSADSTYKAVILERELEQARLDSLAKGLITPWEDNDIKWEF